MPNLFPALRRVFIINPRTLTGYSLTKWSQWFMSAQTNRQIASENPQPDYDNVTRRPDPERLNHLFGCPIREIEMPEDWLFALVTDSYGVVCKEDGQLARLIWDETSGKFREDKTEHE